MKKLLILIFSLFISLNSYGEWTKVYTSTDADYYMDFETFKIREGYINYWQLIDLSMPMSNGEILSAVVRNKIDCSAEGMKSNPIHYYSKEMGNGDLVMSSEVEPPSFTYPPPGSAYYALIGVACDYDL